MGIKGFLVSKNGGPEVLEWADLPVAEPGPGEVLVRHRAVGVNFIDIYFREGLYPIPLPTRLGTEAAGVVEAIGEGVTEVAVGDRVTYCMAPMGAYAETHVVPAQQLIPLPDSVSETVAAAATLKGLTAAFLLYSLRPMSAGETVLVHAAAGGVGQLLCQWAKILGLTVIGSVGSQAKVEIAKERGCDHVVLSDAPDFAQQVRALTDGKGVQVVYDSVGAATFEASLDSLAKRGWMVSYGNASGPAPEIAPLTLLQKGSLVLTRPSLADFVADREEMLTLAKRLFDLIESGQLYVPIGCELPLQSAPEAHRRLQARETQGSTVLVV